MSEESKTRITLPKKKIEGTVKIAGSFSNWQPQNMNRDEVTKLWYIDLNLPTGQHEYKFIINDCWEHCDDLPSKNNDKGTLNNVLVVGPKKEEKKNSIEVERKFIVPANAHNSVCKYGFRHVDAYDEELSDSYYDHYSTNENQMVLMTNDYWLRKRNGDWELKYPVNTLPSKSAENDAPCTIFHETSNIEDILVSTSLKIVSKFNFRNLVSG